MVTARNITEIITGQVEEFAAYPEEWLRFLLSPCTRNYRLRFDEKVMLYHENPEAEMVATYEQWQRIGYQVLRGSRGIPVLSGEMGYDGKLKYYFSSADTIKRGRYTAELWSVQEADSQAILDALGYDASDGSIEKAVRQNIEDTFEEEAELYIGDLKRLDEFSDLYDDEKKDMLAGFRELVTESVTMLVLNRLGIYPEQPDTGRFEKIKAFSSFNLFSTLASMANAVSIEKIEFIKSSIQEDRRRRDVRTNDNKLSDAGRPTVSGPGGEAGNRGIRDLREHAEELSGEEQSIPILAASRERDSGAALPNDRQTGGGVGEQDTQGTDREAENRREPEGDGSRIVGEADERGERDSEGSREDSDHIRIEEAVSAEAPAFSVAGVISDDIVDAVLRSGSGHKNTLEHIALWLRASRDTDSFADLLKNEFEEGGKGFNLNGRNICVRYDGSGMKFSVGTATKDIPDRTLSWQEAAARIRELYLAGSYTDNDMLSDCYDSKIEEVASDLYFVAAEEILRDGETWNNAVPEGVSERLYAETNVGKQILDFHYMVYPDFVKLAKEDLKDADKRNTILSAIKEYSENKSTGTKRYMRTHIENILSGIASLNDAGEPVKQNAGNIIPDIAFITEDEVLGVLRGGSGFSGGKIRIYEYFLGDHSDKEKIEFLKKEYGTGGHSPAIRGSWSSNEDHDAKGIRITKGKNADHSPYGDDAVRIHLKWSTVEKLISGLIRNGNYLNEQERSRYEQKEGEKKDCTYNCKEGDVVYIDSKQYIFLAFKTNTVCLQDAQYPIFKTILTKEDFMRKIRANPLNDHLLVKKGREDQTEQVTDSTGEITERDPDELLGQQDPDVSDSLKGEIVTIDREKYEVIADNGEESILKNISDDAEREEHLTRTESTEKVKDYVEGVQEDESESIPVEPVTQVVQSTLPVQDAHQYKITDDALGVGGPKEKYRRNIAAIKILKQCEEEGRMASPDEQEVLSRYVGWGGLSSAFDSRKENWSKEYEELKSILTKDEYAAARSSTRTSFYTPPVVIRSIYNALQKMGLRNGNILEPSCGIGNFIGMQPDMISDGCHTYGIEIDSISGRIAQQLYQKSRIQVCGYEDSSIPDNFFDVAVGNVPFDDIRVNDKRYNQEKWLIHDYFFGKTLDKVRPGGVIAFITSKGTMDKKNSSVRQYLADRAELIGAVRLPDNTFKDNAGTDKVTTDILFLKKKDRPEIGRDADWVHLGEDVNGIEMNQYFIDHPEMIVGRMEMISTQHGMRSSCRQKPGTDLGEELEKAISNISGTIDPYVLDEAPMETTDIIPADPAVKNFSYAIIDGEVYYREGSAMYKPKKNLKALERIREMIELRDYARAVIQMQIEDYTDQAIRKAQKELEKKYDAFVHSYGLINSAGNRQAFQDDESYYLLSSLEILNDDGTFKRKADIFNKRTISRHDPVTATETASEALTVSLAEKARVDLEYMSELCGMSVEEIKNDLSGVIFRNIVPGDGVSYVTGEEYLSGNVRQKLRYAKEAAQNGEADAQVNVKALESVQPKDLTAAEINVRLGSTWIPAQDVKDFIVELLEFKWREKNNLHVIYNKYTGEWRIPDKGNVADVWNVRNENTYGTKRMNALRLIETALNLRTAKVTDVTVDENGNEKRVVNKKETEAAIAKQELIMQAFKEWIWKDPERRDRLCRDYNERFNSIRTRSYDGSHLQFAGINPTITLKEHQKNAVARVMMGGNTLIAHCVGAGKTFEMTAASQEMKRLGLCKKSLFVVPNHLTEQWGAEYMSLYPGANVLVATKRDFEKSRRKRFCARIATGDYDAIIIGHSQFEKIPMNQEYRRRILEEERDEIVRGIEEERTNYRSDRTERSMTIKQLERTRKSIEEKLKKLNTEDRKDDVVTFDQLGIDRLFVDEAHYYKNLAAFSKMTNVAGISGTEALKSSDMYMKCRYLNEQTGGKGVIFATGTPISNSIVEMYTMQKYLQYDDLKEKELLHFDSWASTFGETKTEYELKPEGTGYQVKTRFARFFNIPELTTMFSQVADIKTEDMLDLPVPDCERHIVAIEPSEFQKAMVQDLSSRADAVRSGCVDPTEDNMLKITNDGRKLALDQRLINPDLPENPESKASVCAGNIADIWEKTKNERSTQMVFCDLSTPDKSKYNVYDDLKAKLIEKGIPEEEIAFVHDAKTDKAKDALFKKVREGQIRVIIGSTFKMGAGTNVQDRLIALHHLDCPWRPSDLQQQEGRILRQGNMNEKVHIYNYVTKGTFDAYMYQLVEGKQKFIGQIMTSKSPARVVDDVDAVALNYAEIKACCADDPLIKEKMELENKVSKLRLLRSSYYSAEYALEDSVNKTYPKNIANLTGLISKLREDNETVMENTVQNPDGISPMVINGITYTDQKEAGAALLEECEAHIRDVGKEFSGERHKIGTFRGLQMAIEFSIRDAYDRTITLWMTGKKDHKITLSTKQATRNISKINETLDGFSGLIHKAEEDLKKNQEQLKIAEAELQKPFAQEEELQNTEKRLAEINKEMEERDAVNIPDGQEDELSTEESIKKQKTVKLA